MAASASSPDADVRAAKRLKIPVDDAITETPETTMEAGLRFVEALKQAKDKTGRPIATNFLTLPDKDEIPEYYEEILLPIAIDTIEGKLRRKEYPDLAAVESDVKRMVNNAKSFNDKKSVIYEDAERIRKTASNFMVKHNPAYRDPGYVAIATPIPERANGNPFSSNADGGAVQATVERPRRAATRAAQMQTPSKTRKLSRYSPEPQSPNDDIADFTGMSFQQAQDQIISDLIKYKDQGGLEVFTPFVNLPPRHLKDYYAVIKHPVSLSGILKRVRGVHGREAPTEITDFTTWDAFEEEVSYIWHNAREYNEEDSQIVHDVSLLENLFNRQIKKAKQKVDEPTQPTLKIKMGAPKQSLKIRLGAGKGSPAPSSAPETPVGRNSATPGVIVDAAALERQQQHVAAGINGQAGAASAGRSSQPPATRSGHGASRPGSSATPIPVHEHSIDPRKNHMGFHSPNPAAIANGVKSESHLGNSQSPAPSTGADEGRGGSVQRHTPQLNPSSMLPPTNSALSASSVSPFHQPQGQVHVQTYYTPPSVFENKYRAAGKTAADSLLPTLTLSTHPALHLPQPCSYTIPPHPELAHQSVTLTLPPTHHTVQLQPFLPVALTNTPYRVFVTVNGNRLSEVVHPGREREKGKPIYEAKLGTGVNRMEVEVVAASQGNSTAKGTPGKGAGAPEVDVEKCTVFVHLLRPT